MSLKLPNDKIVYNLPEQVGINAKNIKAIAEFIDGLNVQDNLVVVEDLSQTLTPEEILIVSRPVSFIYYDNNLYIKNREETGMAYFDMIFSITASSVITFNSKEIEVYLNNGALGIVSSTVATYSSAKIDDLLNAKASLSGATFTGAVVAPTLNQTSFNYEIPIVLSAPTNLSITNIYNRFAVVNGILHVIVNVKLTNNTAADVIVGSGYGLLAQVSMSIDGSIASKLFDLDGNSAAGGATNNTVIATENCIITTTPLSTESTVITQGRITLCNRNAANTVGVHIAVNGTTGARITVPANGNLYITGRIALTII